MLRSIKRWLIIIVGTLLVIILGFVAWGTFVPAAMPEAKTVLKPDYEVLVSRSPWIVFRPILNTPTTGFIIYPGGRVDPRAYAPQAHAIASQGYLVVIVPMPLHLAVFGSGRASNVIQAFPEINNWVIGGHSLGGAMAALYADQHCGQIKGLVLWAAYPAKSDNLSRCPIRVTSIFASLDGLATKKKIDASRPLLPADTVWVEIQGGNHAQFGWYGAQSGDHPATISRQAQQDQVVEATLKLLRSVELASKQ